MTQGLFRSLSSLELQYSPAQAILQALDQPAALLLCKKQCTGGQGLAFSCSDEQRQP